MEKGGNATKLRDLMSVLGTALRWVKGTPSLVARVVEDVHAMRDNDPAARSGMEVLFVYPGLHALWIYRVANDLWKHDARFQARLLGHLGRFLTGVEIHPGATIGRRVVIDHGMGIVIGETAEIGDDCLLYKGVVLGGTSLSRHKRHPTLGKNVVVGSNACILGAIEIGDGARVGSGSVVIRSVPHNATVVGVPARVIVPPKDRFDAALDHANLPDPVIDMIRTLAASNERLRRRLGRIEGELHISSDDEPDSGILPFDGEEMPPVDGG